LCQITGGAVQHEEVFEEIFEEWIEQMRRREKH